MYGSEKAYEILQNAIKQEKKIMLIGDPDVDGLMSLKMMCDYMDYLGLSYTYYVNDNRVHGFTLDSSLLSGYLVICADFSIDRKTLKTIVDNGVDVISTDHHEVEDTFIEYDNGKNKGVVLNNQYPFEPEEERYNSGAGVVYNLFKIFNPEFKSEERDAIVGITLRSDYGFGVPKMDRTFVDFTFSPTINAMLRFNKTQIAIDLILGKGIVSYTDYRLLQTELVRKLKQDVDVLDLGTCYILAIDAKLYQEDVTNFIGLLCSQYTDNQKSALAFVYNGGKILRASFRGRFDDVDYRGGFQELGINAQGHKGAFGIKSFYPNADTWKKVAEMVGVLEKDHKDTRTVIESNNLSVTLLNKGSNFAYDNCFVRDMYRTYIRYTGKNAKEVRTTYRMVEFSMDDYANRRKPDRVKGQVSYKFELDKDGNKMVKYREFSIDGKTVKSFGLGVSDGLIMPILEKGYLNLYLV